MKHSISYHAVPRETFDAADTLIKNNQTLLSNYVDQLFWWNQRINLVSRDVSRETVFEHIRHSLLLTQFDALKHSSFIVDAGTGGGLPGLPLAIANPEKSILLNDIVTKKVLAVKQMTRKLNLANTETVDKSIAELTINSPFLLVSKHAFKVDTLFELTKNLPWEVMVLYKSINFEDEIPGVKTPLTINVFDLFKESGNSFYKDKAIIIIERISNN